MNHMMAMARDDFYRWKKQKPFSPEEERANVFSIENDEIGLLDIVLLDAIEKSEARNQ